MRIGFNRPPFTGAEQKYVLDAMSSPKISGDGSYGLKCQTWFEGRLGCLRALLTPSCTQALEMSAMLVDIKPGDEVIMPSYTFVSTANAFVLRGAKIVFVDIRPDTMNMDESLIEAAVTAQTAAIVAVHYAGIACEMDTINNIALRHNLVVIEDAAQAMMSTYNNRPLGTLGHFGAYSFHETKNITSGGEGGLLTINDERFIQRAEVIREKGTNRSNFFRGMVDKYTWVDIGSSYLPSEIQAAYLWGQLEQAANITANRMATWKAYHTAFHELALSGRVGLPSVPDNCAHNGHMYYLKCRDSEERDSMIAHLAKNGVHAVSHYVPLHSSPAGLQHGRFCGEDRFTTLESARLLRLPLWFGMGDLERERVIRSVLSFYV